MSNPGKKRLYPCQIYQKGAPLRNENADLGKFV